MTAAQMLHERYVKGLRQTLADTSRKRSRKERERLEMALSEALAVGERMGLHE